VPRRLALLAFPVAAVAAVVVAELTLPRLAAARVAERLGGRGAVERVRVTAVPAVKLLWGRADIVEVELSELGGGRGSLAESLADARGVRRLDVRARLARFGPVALRELRLSKDGADVVAEATVAEADLVAAMPAGFGLRPVATADGTLVLEAGAALLGVRAALRARLAVREGRLMIAADGPLARLGTMTLFDDPRVSVTSVGARAVPGGFTITAVGRLAGWS
jgi:hypothetical protein